MSYLVSFVAGEGIVLVCLSGQATHAEHIDAKKDALHLLKENKCTRLLVDMRDLNAVFSSTMDCHSFGEALPRSMPSISIANVLPTNPESKKLVHFTACVAGNRGAIIKEFESVELAKKWLITGKTKSS